MSQFYFFNVGNSVYRVNLTTGESWVREDGSGYWVKIKEPERPRDHNGIPGLG